MSERVIADQVVYEGQTGDQEINEEVIKTYCEVIGIDYESEKDLLWIAEEGARAPIPEPWKACRDTTSGEFYYFNFRTGESQWDHPMDEFYSQKVVTEREKLKKKTRVAGRNIADHTNPLESRTEPFRVPGSEQDWLSRTALPDVQLGQTSRDGKKSAGAKEDGKRFLKSAKKLYEDDSFDMGGNRGERLMFDLDDQDQASPTAPVQLISSSQPASNAYEDDYEEDVDFGDGDDRHLSEFLLEKESTLEPELANLASTGDHDNGTSQFSQAGDAGDGQITTGLPAARPRNPLADSSRVAQSMTATSFDASEYLANRDPAELEARLKGEYHNIQLELLEEHESKIQKLKAEMEATSTKEEENLRQKNEAKIEKLKEELAAALEQQKEHNEKQIQNLNNAKKATEEDMRRQLDEVKEQTQKAIETERQWLENREAEVSKRLAAARADISEEVERRLGSERAQMESEYAARVASLRKEISAVHDTEMAKLRNELEEANYREQESKRAEIRSAEQRVSSVKVLESEMGVSLDRRKAELHEEHENSLAKIRRENERAIATAKQNAELELNNARTESSIQLEEARRAIADETERQVSAARKDGERARATAIARIAGLEDDLKGREDRIAKKEREINDTERKTTEKERLLKSKMEEVKRKGEELEKEEEEISRQKTALEAKRAELAGIQHAISVDEMVKQHAQKSTRKSSHDKHVDDNVPDTQSVMSSTSKESTKRKKMSKFDKRLAARLGVESSELVSEGDTENDSDDEDTTVAATNTSVSKRTRKNKSNPPRFSDLIPISSNSSGDDDGTGLGKNGKKVRKLLLNLLFPHEKSPNNSDDLDQVEDDKPGIRLKSSKMNTLPSELVDISDDEESNIDLAEIRSRIRTERIRAFQKEQHNRLQNTASDIWTDKAVQNEPSPVLSSGSADHRYPFSLYNFRLPGMDIDRYLSARWYQLYRGSAYSAPVRSQSSWQLPLSSASTKYGYVPARELLMQYSAGRFANAKPSSDLVGVMDLNRSMVK